MVSAWTRLRAALDPLARRYNLYTAYTIGNSEFVGTMDGTVADAREQLRANGYTPQYLSAAKRLPGTGQLHDLSYRHVPETHPSAWTDDRFAPSECQYHVHAFATDDAVRLFSHYEVRPDTWRPLALRTHYRPAYGQTYLRGVTNLEV